MRLKPLGVAAAVALAGVAGVSGLLRAQEKEEARAPMRVLELSQGSYLGVYIADVTAEDVEELGLPEERGVRVTGMAEEGPARDAGLQDDDVILSWNGDRVESEAQLRRILRETPAGRSATLGVFRDGSEQSIRVELGRPAGRTAFGLRTGWDEDQVDALRERVERAQDRVGDVRVRLREMPHVMTFMSMRGGRLGVGIQSLGPQLGEYFGLGDRTGVLITTVNEDSPASAAGLMAGDVIIAVDGEEIEDAGDVTHLVWGAEAGPVAIRILRDGSERTVTVDLPEAENSWRFDDGETHGLFFIPEDPGLDEVELDRVESLLELPRLGVFGPPEGPVEWVPAQSVRPARRALSI